MQGVVKWRAHFRWRCNKGNYGLRSNKFKKKVAIAVRLGQDIQPQREESRIEKVARAQAHFSHLRQATFVSHFPSRQLNIIWD